MSVNIWGLLYCERFVLDEMSVRALVDILINQGWTYNVELEDGYRRKGGTWTFEEASDDQQDDQKLQNAIHNVVEADGGAISLSRTLPDGPTTGTTVSIRSPSPDADFWRISVLDRARLFSGQKHRANRRLLINLFAELADQVSPYVGNLGPEPAVFNGFDGDFDSPPPYFTGVTYLSHYVPGVQLDKLIGMDVAHRTVELSDGVLFEACENDPPWNCDAHEVEELESFLGIEYYPS